MLEPCHCLVVDDDPMFNLVAEGVLRTLCDGRIATAGSGRAGLELLGHPTETFDFVFLDLNMPDLDGLAFMREAAKAGFRGKIIISSGEAQAILHSARNLGNLLGMEIAGAIRKPLNIAEVQAIFDSGRQARPRTSAAAGQIELRDEAYDLTPYYQPQYSLESGAVVGFEALLRLTTKDGQIHGPSKLFDSLRDHSHLVDVSMRIAERVLADISAWQAIDLYPKVSINFDASVLERPDVVATIQDLIKTRQIEAKRICLEVTERTLPSNLSMLVEGVTRLRMAGFNLSLDDYGTGSSNFELLRLCPFSELKLDRNIVAGSVDDPISRRFMQSACHLAQDLDIFTVAEGVENQGELAQVLSAGTDAVQGFLFARPLPAAEVRRIMTESEAKVSQQLLAARG